MHMYVCIFTYILLCTQMARYIYVKYEHARLYLYI